MNARIGCLLFLLPWFAIPAHAQESVRDLGGPGQYSKLLALGQLDRWVFEGEKGETIIAHVASREFDPILELAKAGAKDDKLLLEVDDPGNESRFAIRLPEKGRYEIRIHAFKYQGGGNYTLQVSRFQAKRLGLGEALIGAFDREGKGYHHFEGTKDQILIPELKGPSSEAWKVLDFKGREMPNWAGAVLVEANGGCHLVVSGPPNYRYSLLVREARTQDFVEGKELAGNLQSGEMAVCSFQAKPGMFRLLQVEKKGELLSRLLYAPLEKSGEQRISQPGERPEIIALPVSSRGGHIRYAAILGREGRYQLQLVARTPSSYKLTATDPSVPLESGPDTTGKLSVGGAAYYSFKATPGQLVQAGLASQQFVPSLRLYDPFGSLVGNGNVDDGLECHVAHTIMNEGLYRLQVSSVGDGGGGDFRLGLGETKLKELQVGGRGQGTVQPGATDSWAFSGKEGATVFLSVRSSEFEPNVSLRSPDGVLLATDKGSATTGSLFAFTLPKTGRYSVWIASNRGAGDYTVRLIDGD